MLLVIPSFPPSITYNKKLCIQFIKLFLFTKILLQDCYKEAVNNYIHNESKISTLYLLVLGIVFQ